jgi:hypothetical protein
MRRPSSVKRWVSFVLDARDRREAIGFASSAVLPCALFEELAIAARCLLGSVQFGRCYLSGGLFVTSVDHGCLGLAVHRSCPDWAV